MYSTGAAVSVPPTPQPGSQTIIRSPDRIWAVVAPCLRKKSPEPPGFGVVVPKPSASGSQQSGNRGPPGAPAEAVPVPPVEQYTRPPVRGGGGVGFGTPPQLSS